MALHFREATRVYRKTLPYVLLQLAVGVAFALLGVIYLGIVVWLGLRVFSGDGGASSLVVAAVLLFGLVTFGFAWRLIQRYVLYLVKTGHVAVIAHAVEEGEVPDDQIRYGIEQVSTYFVSASALYGVATVIDAVLEQFTHAATRVGNALPVPVPGQLQTLLAVLWKSVELAMSYIDEAIVAYMFLDRDENRWKSARDGLVLYGKTWKPVLGSTLLVVVGMYVLAFVLLLALAPFASALEVLPAGLEALSWVLLGGVVAAVHTGIVKPWVKTVVITTFLLESRGERPDSETLEWMADRSERFREVLEKAERGDPIDGERQEIGVTSGTTGREAT